jgi:hypothetical protein
MRHGFSGGLFLIVLLLEDPCRNVYLHKLGEISTTAVLVGVALLVGTLIYTFHRALIYRLIFAIAQTILTKSLQKYFRASQFRWSIWWPPFLSSPMQEKIDYWRLALRARSVPKEDPVVRFTDEWGAQVHFLYCSAWAIIIAMFFGPWFLKSQNNLSGVKLGFLALTFFGAGLWSHLSLLIWILRRVDGQSPTR